MRILAFRIQKLPLVRCGALVAYLALQSLYPLINCRVVRPILITVSTPIVFDRRCIERLVIVSLIWTVAHFWGATLRRSI